MIEKTVGDVRLQFFPMAAAETIRIVPEFDVYFELVAGVPARRVIGAGSRLPVAQAAIDPALETDWAAGSRSANFPRAPPDHPSVDRGLRAGHQQNCSQSGPRYEGHVLSRARSSASIQTRTSNSAAAWSPGRSACGTRGRRSASRSLRSGRKLKPEYADYSSLQIVELKKQGIAIRTAWRSRRRLLRRLGHRQLPRLRPRPQRRGPARRVYLLRARPPGASRQGQHTHVTDLPALYERVRRPNVVLVHLTRRTGLGDAKRYLSKVLRPRPTADHHPHGPAPRKPGRRERKPAHRIRPGIKWKASRVLRPRGPPAIPAADMGGISVPHSGQTPEMLPVKSYWQLRRREFPGLGTPASSRTCADDDRPRPAVTEMPAPIYAMIHQDHANVRDEQDQVSFQAGQWASLLAGLEIEHP